MSPTPALQVESLDHSFRGRLVLSGVTFGVAPGDILCVLGPSGCGKTTLLRIIAGLLKPKHGRISINGKSQKGIPASKRDLGFVFQRPVLFPTMNVYRNVAFPFRQGRKEIPRAHGTESQAVAEILKRTGLSGFEKYSVATLSGGQQQRVALARALVYNPTLLLLDEPLSSVDTVLRDELLDLLLELHDQSSTTMVYVTHDEREALRIATHLAILDGGGQLLQHDSTNLVMSAPQHPDVARLTGAWNFFTVMAFEPSAAIPAIYSEAWSAVTAGLGSDANLRSILFGVPMSAVQLESDVPQSSASALRLPILVRRRVRWHSGWRFECDVENRTAHDRPFVCFGPLDSPLEIGSRAIAVFSREALRVFKSEPGDDGGNVAAVDGSERMPGAEVQQ